MKLLGKLINLVFRKTPLLRQLDGHKTNIGAVLIVLSSLSTLLLQLSGVFPAVPQLGELGTGLAELLSLLEKALITVGIPVLHVGVLGKLGKTLDKE